jgi:ABC-2 type transport system ATP-binding protein
MPAITEARGPTAPPESIETIDAAVEVRHLTKRYGAHVAVDGVDLTIHRGEVFGILGANGAGKTTAVECAQGLRRPDGGTVRVLGLDPVRQRARLGSRVGSQLQHSELPDRMRVGEALRLFADGRLPEAAGEEWGLRDLWRTPFGGLSGGQRQRLFVGLALLNDPEVVFLDELTQGLDPAARRAVWNLIAGIRARSTTVVLVTHFADEAEVLCDRVAVMRQGRIVAEGTPAELTERHGPGVSMAFTLADPDVAALRRVPGVEAVVVSGRRVEVHGRRAMVAPVGAHLVAGAPARCGAVPHDIRVSEPTLEAALLHLLDGDPDRPDTEEALAS